MTYFYPGYQKAVASVNAMDETELLGYLDDLFGRDNLPENYTLAQLREEALRQCRQEFTDKLSPEYEASCFWLSMLKAQRQNY